MGKLRNTLDDVENRPRPRVMADGSKSFPEKLPDREGTGRSVNVLGGIAGGRAGSSSRRHIAPEAALTAVSTQAKVIVAGRVLRSCFVHLTSPDCVYSCT